MSIVYIEFLYPIVHYFKTIRKNEAVFDLVIPIFAGIAAIIVGILYNCVITPDNANDLFKTIITLLSILVGFTISSITILTATSEKLNIDTERKIGKNSINLYQLTNVIFIFTLFSEIITLVINLIAVLLISYEITFVIDHINKIVILDVILISHILLLNIRNITNFYFILHKIKSI